MNQQYRLARTLTIATYACFARNVQHRCTLSP
jgi:hypothetical protein